MKRLFFAVTLALCALGAFAAETVSATDTYDYDMLVSTIPGVSAPYVSGDYVVFTAKRESRYVGIAFDFEGYTKIHQFQLHKSFDYEGTVTDSWFFYVLEKPKKLESISYRLVIDGLWTTDPTNPDRRYNAEDAIMISYIPLPKVQEVATETAPDGFTRFVCFAPTGQKIRLAGTFTNWDSWIYEMTEVSRGKYQLDLPLSSGEYYYAYYSGMSSFIDETNPLKGYTQDGRTASKIIVQ